MDWVELLSCIVFFFFSFIKFNSFIMKILLYYHIFALYNRLAFYIITIYLHDRLTSYKIVYLSKQSFTTLCDCLPFNIQTIVHFLHNQLIFHTIVYLTTLLHDCLACYTIIQPLTQSFTSYIIVQQNILNFIFINTNQVEFG